MAKKTVASLQTGGGRQHTKVIKMVRSEKTGAYAFKEEVVHNDEVKAGSPRTEEVASTTTNLDGLVSS